MCGCPNKVILLSHLLWRLWEALAMAWDKGKESGSARMVLEKEEALAVVWDLGWVLEWGLVLVLVVNEGSPEPPALREVEVPRGLCGCKD